MEISNRNTPNLKDNGGGYTMVEPKQNDALNEEFKACLLESIIFKRRLSREDAIDLITKIKETEG